MKLGNTRFYINKSRTACNTFNTNIFGQWEDVTYPSEKFDEVVEVYRSYQRLYTDREETLKKILTKYGVSETVARKKKAPKITVTTDVDAETVEMLKNTMQNLMNFFSEFEFEPNFRFVNTLSYCVQESKKAAKEYITNYFRLTDSSYTYSIMEKMKSAEFGMILDNLSKVVPTHRVNNRFRLFYGAQGTGKTTDAYKVADDRCMVCHSAMLPSDLMEDFKFVDGKAAFHPSALFNAMVEGNPIVLDEINLLPFESLRFLQSILDGKKEFMYKGTNVVIKDGFQIIGTMNLSVNNSIYALPAPLVDRCQEIKEYKLTAESLLGAIL